MPNSVYWDDSPPGRDQNPFNDAIEDDVSLLPLNAESSALDLAQNGGLTSMADTNFISPELAGSDLKGAFFNMTNSIVGAGIVGIPRAFKNSGLVLGILLMITLTFLNDWTLRLIIINTKLSGSKSYTGFVTHSFGTTGKIIVLLAQGLFAFGGAIGFSVIIGDSIPHVLRSIFHESVENNALVNFILGRNSIIVFCIVFISYPLSLIRDMSKLAKASGLALISMTIIIVLVILRASSMPAELKGGISGSEWFVSPNFFQGISVISFALVCHHNTTFIYDSIRVPTLDRFNSVTFISCMISGFVCSLIGIVGFLNFGSFTRGNILNNFPSDDWVINIARLCFGLNMLTTFPLEIFVIREVFKDLIIIYHQQRDPSYELNTLTGAQHFIVTSICSFIPMTISLFTCNLSAILELVGATSGSTLAYILPPLCYYKMTWRNKSLLQRAPIIGCVLFGFSVMFLSSFQTILEAIRNTDGSSHCVD
ncbi:Avt2 protein [Martiniozyma asiatica (nom. inval.)]|nr:Avt2 protein [Martiniozyma asiatica]